MAALDIGWLTDITSPPGVRKLLRAQGMKIESFGDRPGQGGDVKPREILDSQPAAKSDRLATQQRLTKRAIAEEIHVLFQVKYVGRQHLKHVLHFGGKVRRCHRGQVRLAQVLEPSGGRASANW